MDLKANILLKTQSLFTAAENKPINGFVAIGRKRVLAAGESQNSYSWIGPKTEVIDVGSKTILPGFFDSHLHIKEGFFTSASVDLSSCRSEEEAAETLFLQSSGKGLGRWMTGCGWHHMFWEKQREPAKESLDLFFPNTPVLCINDEGHGAWVNSKALEMCGFDHRTPDPKGGIIKRDKNNNPTGYLLETAAFMAMDQIFGLRTLIPSLMGIARLLKEFSRFGVTSISDMQNHAIDNRIFRLFERLGRLPVRIHLFPYLYSEEDQKQQWSYIEKMYQRFRSEMIRTSGVKIFCDGTPLCHTGLMLEPYTDQPENMGETLHGYQQTQALIVEAAKKGYNVRAHACGDGAVRLALDSFEAAAQYSVAQDLKHAIEHIEVINPDDIQRFAELNVTASVQPEHMEIDTRDGKNPFDAIVGKKRKKYLWAFKSLLDSGARLAFGTDMPVVGINPFLGIYRAVTRRQDDGYPSGGWLAEQKLTLPQALRAYTIDAAYANSRGHDLGSLEAGKLADLIVLDRDIFSIPESEIKELSVDLTMMNGKFVYQKN